MIDLDQTPVEPGSHEPRNPRRPRSFAAKVARSRVVRVAVAVLAVIALVAYLQRTYLLDQLADYAVDSRTPPTTEDLRVDPDVLRSAAERSRGTHNEDGAVHHTVNYQSELLVALEQPTYSVEVDVTYVEGEGMLQHDPEVPLGMPLIEFLEYAAIAEFPIIKLDLKRDRVDPIMDDVQRAVDEFGLDPTRVQFNADVFDGPGLERDFLGGRDHFSFVDARYNQLMELEVEDLERIAGRFPRSRILISAVTRSGPTEGYSEQHVRKFLGAAALVRRVNPDQPLAFVMRGNLAVNTDSDLLYELTTVPNSYIAVWWNVKAPAEPGDIELLRSRGASFFDLGRPGEVE